ncbi:mitochondria-eating protein [Caerostris extrusa]|nr:mitochondria-eating protein [Caerostris extrusa]
MNCLRLAWSLINQSPPYVINYEDRVFREHFHVRFHSSDHKSEVIKSYYWPPLTEGEGGPCVQQGVVLT